MTKRHKIIYISLAIAAVFLSAGCSNDEAIQSVQSNEVEIHFTAAAVGTPAITRADASDTYNDALTAGSSIGVYIYGYETSNATTGYDISQYITSATQPNDVSKTWVYQTVGEAVATSDGKQSNLVLTSHSKAPKFPAPVSTGNGDMDHVDIFAIFPNNTAITPSTDSYRFTVDRNQRDENIIKAADLMTSDKAPYTKIQCEGQSLRIDLKHRMAKVHVTFVPKTGSDLTTDNMPTNFDIIGVRRTVVITPKAGTVVLATNGDDSDATTASSPMLGTASQSFFIPPQTINSGSTFLKFNIKANADGRFKGISGCTFAPSSNVTFQAGYRYEITVTVDVDFVGVTGTITSWSEETLPYSPVIL